ncbi:hypothetical protein CULT_100071 [[Clostridium] ultunense Esp]|uniref:type I-MYXAN CRISPR-associated Cas8a1/Cmx1 n=1 Tax=Thermicanus aegyptius TaxID=94009 RepID=UPI0002B700B6|nr:type I-MYXAN CRISPR-associated Cas8a1/Cmx1 [Thermicanus aegyptius]CCQ92533.1 hypothetical protein CULT_100071 [[Clostridium] ultunense Esp]
MNDGWGIFDLNAPGMSPLHRAGMTGLVASLKRMKELDFLRDEWRYEIKGNMLRLPHLGTETEAIAELFRNVYRIDEDGLIDFPLYHGLSRVYKAHVQQVLLGTFLQHPRTRKAAKHPVKINDRIDEKDIEVSFLPLYDFQHRNESTAKEISEGIKKQKKIEIAGWAMPGGMVRHNAVKGTALQETPDRYFLLMFAPLGCLYYLGSSFLKNGDFDPKTQYLLGIPRPTRLQEQTEQLIDLYKYHNGILTRHLVVTGESDATLLSAAFFHIDTHAYELGYDFQIQEKGVRNFQVMRFGTVGWSKQQKTRTGVASVSEIKMEVLKRYLLVDEKLSPRRRVSQAGEEYEEVMPMRDKISENLIQGRPWYAGFAEYVQDRRGRKVLSWGKELAELTEKIVWNDESKKQFIRLVQVAIKNRYGKVAAEAKQNNADLFSLLDREYDRLVLTFSKCRTRENFREELLRFIAQNHANLPGLTQEQRISLLYLGAIDTNWKEARDLCLLALATYQGTDRTDDKDANDKGTKGKDKATDLGQNKQSL